MQYFNFLGNIQRVNLQLLVEKLQNLFVDLGLFCLYDVGLFWTLVLGHPISYADPQLWIKYCAKGKVMIRQLMTEKFYSILLITDLGLD